MGMSRCLCMGVFVFLAGCATSSWQLVGNGNTQWKSAHCQVSSLPVGWARLSGDEALLLTKEGVLLQSISVRFAPHSKAFPVSKRHSSEAMLPSELAEYYVAELRKKNPDLVINQKALAPAFVDKGNGFRLEQELLTKDGLPMTSVVYGLADKSGVYLLEYNAPSLYYAGRDMNTFETLVTAFRRG